jgi:hypothetical protein
MADLKRSWLTIGVTVVRSFFSRSVSKMTSICQKARASLVVCELEPRRMCEDAPDRHDGLSSGFYDLLQVLRALSVQASPPPVQHRL